MIEYGLSVSLDGTPRTPHCCDYGPSPKNNAPRKYMTFGDIRDGGDGGDGGDGVSVSISPRALFSDVAVVPPPTATARRLDFDKTELSPVSFASVSASAVASAAASASVGECGVCYNALPCRSNHVFTLCGHLFCVSCLLKWCDVNMTCPICRADLIDSVSDDDDDDDTVVNDAVDVERIQLQTQAALNDRIYSDGDDSDSGEDSGDDGEDSDIDGGSELYWWRSL